MKFTLIFKTPDVFDRLESLYDSDDNDKIDNLKSFIEKFVKYQEYVYIEFDDEKQTATVLRHI